VFSASENELDVLTARGCLDREVPADLSRRARLD
jgi:hypothetical protein